MPLIDRALLSLCLLLALSACGGGNTDSGLSDKAPGALAARILAGREHAAAQCVHGKSPLNPRQGEIHTLGVSDSNTIASTLIALLTHLCASSAQTQASVFAASEGQPLNSTVADGGRDVTFGPLVLRLPARWKLVYTGPSAWVDTEMGEMVFDLSERDEPGVTEPFDLPGAAVSSLRTDLMEVCGKPSTIRVAALKAPQQRRLFVGVCETYDMEKPRYSSYFVRYVVHVKGRRIAIYVGGQGSSIEARILMDSILGNAKLR